jgi:hypothetical protein
VQDFALKSQTEQEAWTRLTDRDAEEFEAVYDQAGLQAQSGLRFTIESATAWRVTPDVRILRIPVASGQAVEQQTSITVFFDDAGAPGARSSKAFSSQGGSISTMDYQQGDWWGNFNQCLSNAGIAAWVITGISIACAAVCVATLGAGCLVCLGAASAGFSGTVTFCIGMANHYS